MLKVQLLDHITSIVDDIVDVVLSVVLVALLLNDLRDFSVSVFKDLINFILKLVLLIGDFIDLDLEVDVLNLLEASRDLIKDSLDLRHLVWHS